MLKGKSKYITIILLVLSLLLPGCARQEEQEVETESESVISLTELNFELEDFIGEKVWASGFYGDDRFTGDGVAFLVRDFHMMIVDEKMPDHSFARLDGNMPPYDMNEAEIIVYGEVKDFAQTYGVVTLLSTPLITVEEYRILTPPVTAIGTNEPLFSPTTWGNFVYPQKTFAEASTATLTKAKDCDRALIISGGIDDNNNRSRFQKNMRAKYQKLKELGFSDDQIGVLYNDGGEVKTTEKDEGNNEVEKNIVDAKASKQKIRETLEKYKEEMPASCTLVIFVTDHGTGYNDEQGYRGARSAFSGVDSKTKTYPEKTFELDLCYLVYASDGWLKIKSKEWDTNRDGEVDLKAECDGETKEYVLKRKMPDGTWKEIGRASGDTKKWGIKCRITGIDWNGDDDLDDQIGFHEGINLWGKEVLWDNELAEMLKPLHEKGIHIVVEMAQCFGGGFVDNLKGIVDKIVTFSGEDTKHHNRKDASGKRYAADEMAFAENLAGIDLQSWNKAFDKAKEVDTEEWEDEGGFDDEKNEYRKWEKPLIQTESTFYEEDGTYTVSLKIPQSLKDTVYDFEIFFGLQKPRWEKGEALELPEGFTAEGIAGGIRIKSGAPFPLTPLVFKFKGPKGAESIRIHVTDKEHKNLGYITPTKTTPPVPPTGEPVYTRSPEMEDCAEWLGQNTGLKDCNKSIFPDLVSSEHIEFMIYRLSTLLANPDPYIPVAKKECASGLLEFLEEAASESDRQWVADIFVDSYHEAQEACRTDIVETEVLRVSLEASAQSIRDESRCTSTLTISFDGIDLTGGNYQVSRVVLTVNGQVWHDSGDISTVHYQNSVSRELDCGETLSMKVTATNAYDQTATVTSSIATPVP